jgi:hypothetical protein
MQLNLIRDDVACQSIIPRGCKPLPQPGFKIFDQASHFRLSLLASLGR